LTFDLAFSPNKISIGRIKEGNKSTRASTRPHTKYASVLDEVLKAVTIKITIFCVIIKCIVRHNPNDVSEQSVASTFMEKQSRYRLGGAVRVPGS